MFLATNYSTADSFRSELFFVGMQSIVIDLKFNIYIL
jgi:hypothetical protein